MVAFIVNTSIKLNKYLLVFHFDKYKEHMGLEGKHTRSSIISQRPALLQWWITKSARVDGRTLGNTYIRNRLDLWCGRETERPRDSIRDISPCWAECLSVWKVARDSRFLPTLLLSPPPSSRPLPGLLSQLLPNWVLSSERFLPSGGFPSSSKSFSIVLQNAPTTRAPGDGWRQSE